jgi:hypothetical protein
VATTDIITKGRVIENSAVTLTARIRNADDYGTPTTPADISTIRLRVYDLTADPDGVLVVPAGASLPYTGTDLDPADVFLASLNTGYMADDADGFNFRLDLDGSYFPDGDKTYRVECLITPLAADAYYRLWELKTLNVYSE